MRGFSTSEPPLLPAQPACGPRALLVAQTYPPTPCFPHGRMQGWPSFAHTPPQIPTKPGRVPDSRACATHSLASHPGEGHAWPLAPSCLLKVPRKHRSCPGASTLPSTQVCLDSPPTPGTELIPRASAIFKALQTLPRRLPGLGPVSKGLLLPLGPKRPAPSQAATLDPPSGSTSTQLSSASHRRPSRD